MAAGGHVVIATFALSGPSRCSGLDVVRYDADSLSRELGSGFSLSTHFETPHTTPMATEQRFLYCVFERR